jgi:hypothetical protein
MTFFIDTHVVSWNTLLRKHFRVVSKSFEELKWATMVALAGQRVKPVKSEGVHLIFEAHWKGKRIHDCDNVCVKPIIDTLVDRGIIPRDDTRFVKSVTLRGFTECPTEQYVVTIEIC